MKLLFIPYLPSNNNIACRKLKEMVVNQDVAIIIYTSFYALSSFIDIKNILGEESIDNNRIIIVAPGGSILELGRTNLGYKNEGLTRFAAPGNNYTDFIPLVIEYYEKNNIKIENVFIVIDKENINCCYSLSSEKKLDGDKMNEELQIYAEKYNISYTYTNLSSNWVESLSIAENSYLARENNISLMNKDILYNPFFDNVLIPKKFSILFTDRDGTIITDDFNENYINFEYMKKFLSMGNVIVVIPSGNHAARIYEEGVKYESLWEILLPYKNQIIGFPAMGAGVTLGGFKIPIGGCTMHKNGFVSPIVEMFLNRGYCIEKVFAIGDTIHDFDILLEAAYQFNGISYIIENSYIQDSKSYPNPFTEADWNYIENHFVTSFSSFMKHFVYPSINNKDCYDSILKENLSKNFDIRIK